MNINEWEEKSSHNFYIIGNCSIKIQRGGIMFSLEGKLTFINIEQNYLRKMHDACSGVYYRESGYENKPHIGILINKNNRKYVIPLSSAKEKHKTWKNVNKECYLIYELAKRSCMGQSDIWIDVDGENVKHILSVIDIKKMIPIIDGVYCRVNINPEDSDTEELRKYKDLLNKEYIFCLKIIDEIIGKANKLYDKQMSTGKIAKYGCDFKMLEKIADMLNGGKQ